MHPDADLTPLDRYASLERAAAPVPQDPDSWLGRTRGWLLGALRVAQDELARQGAIRASGWWMETYLPAQYALREPELERAPGEPDAAWLWRVREPLERFLGPIEAVAGAIAARLDAIDPLVTPGRRVVRGARAVDLERPGEQRPVVQALMYVPLTFAQRQALERAARRAQPDLAFRWRPLTVDEFPPDLDPIDPDEFGVPERQD